MIIQLTQEELEAIKVALDSLAEGDAPRFGSDFLWALVTVDALDPAVEALHSNPGWKLLHVGTGTGGQTTLTFGWPWEQDD